VIKTFADKRTKELYESGKSRAGQFSICVNDQWRVCFRFEDGDEYGVEITDYH
jgi:proteic killer suppression protein